MSKGNSAAADHRPVRRSIHSSLRRGHIVLIVAFCGIFAVLHELLRRSDAHAARFAMANSVAESLARDFELFQLRHNRAEGDITRLTNWCEFALRNDAVQSVELLDSNSLVVAYANREACGSVLSASPSGSASAPLEKDSSDNLQLVTVSLPMPLSGQGATRLRIRIKSDNILAGGLSHLSSFYIPLAAMGLGCFFLGQRHLRRTLLEPLASLARAARNTDQTDLEVVHRGDDFGVVAAALNELRAELDGWREQAQRVEKRMTSKLSEATRRISLDLKRVQNEAWVDSLTGVKNRRLLEERMPAIFEAQRKARKDLSVVMFDLDHFKIMNDTLGHWAGDELLAFTGELLRSCTRAEDVVARYGGDEFAVILPGAAEYEAVAMSERVIAMFRQRAKMISRIEPVPSMSAGIASLLANHPQSHRDLLTMADRALYIAKRSGRNRAHALVRHERLLTA